MLMPRTRVGVPPAWVVAATVLVSLGMATWAGAATTSGDADQPAIIDTIQSQLDAFQRDDGIEAFSYASPRIQERFRTPGNFMAMVRTGYPAVYRPSAVEFLDIELRDGRIFQPVRFVGPDGEAVIAIYEMERQVDGIWKINGVYLVRMGEVAS